jgi:glucose/arabinose dehydrogenase
MINCSGDSGPRAAFRACLRASSPLTAVVLAICLVVARDHAAPAVTCAPDNGGITLPPGFCAAVVADNVGPARHLVVAPNGDLFVALRTSRGENGGIVALHDSNGDGTMDTRERFGDCSVTGIALRNGYLYYATPTSVMRYKMAAGALKPDGAAEPVITGLPERRQHADKSMAFDGKGAIFVNVGAPSNACQQRDRTEKSPGQDPCPLLDTFGGIWRFDENRTSQKAADGRRYATGMRQMIALAWHDNALFVAMHGRDQLNTLWPGKFTDQQNAELPSETLLKVTDGANFGWPYCMHDWMQNTLVLNPEYGGDGKQVGRCDQFTPPIAAFPGHWAPNDLLFYDATMFPQKYRGGAFIAFHGSWNRAPLPQGGYNVAFVPFAGGKPSGKYEVFADGFAGKMPLAQPGDAVTRPEGLSVGPDGSLYVSEGQKGRIWRIVPR